MKVLYTRVNSKTSNSEAVFSTTENTVALNKLINENKLNTNPNCIMNDYQAYSITLLGLAI